MDNEKQQLNIELKPDVASGSYSNLAIISHSPTEFIIDFASTLPGLPKPQVQSRIIMNPEHAKRLLAALNENVNKYEAQFGPIQFKTAAPKATFNLADFPQGGSKS